MPSPHLQRAVDVGRHAQAAAAKVRNSLFPHWRQRSFRRHLGRFIVALQEIPQAEAMALPTADIHALSDIVDGVVAEAEAFMSERHDATTKEIEQDRFVVTEIYQLRAIVETLARRFTPDPDFEDVEFKVRTKHAHDRSRER